VNVLIAQGAIPMCKTNLSQTMLSFDCGNPLFGTTVNPHDPSRSPGGSSGGEGALIALNGCAFGIGTDVGGSVRIPAAFCGVCALKPTAKRISRLGMREGLPGQSGPDGMPGVMARDVETVALVMQALLADDHMSQMDAYVPPVPFSLELYDSTDVLVVGVYDFDGFFEPVPACRRAVWKAHDILQETGRYQFVPFRPPRALEAQQFYFRLMGADGGATLRRLLHGETLDKCIEPLIRLSGVSVHARERLSCVLVVHVVECRICRVCSSRSLDLSRRPSSDGTDYGASGGTPLRWSLLGSVQRSFASRQPRA
jgi:fatty acid amide hydrolase